MDDKLVPRRSELNLRESRRAIPSLGSGRSFIMH
jgi:hypothetical protein